MTSNLQNIFLKAERLMVTNCHIPCLGTLNYFGTCHCRKYLTTVKLQEYRHDTIHSDYIAWHTGRSSHNLIPRSSGKQRQYEQDLEQQSTTRLRLLEGCGKKWDICRN